MIQALKKYRPTKTADGGGGFTRTLGTAATIYGSLAPDKVGLGMLFTSGQDIEAEDIIETNATTRYVVLNVSAVLGALDARAELERIERPIGG